MPKLRIAETTEKAKGELGGGFMAGAKEMLITKTKKKKFLPSRTRS